MGVLSDLVVIPERDLAQLAASDVPSEDFDGIDINGVMPEHFAALHEVVTGTPFDEIQASYEPIVTVSAEDGPWISRIPDELVRRLAGFDTTTIDGTARRWIAAAEGMDAESAEVVELLGAICELARQAPPDRSMFLWVSL
jgi:hypothetical protein